MPEQQNKLRLLLDLFFCFMALIIIIDFTWPGRKIVENVLEVQSEREQYYNAAGNYHFSYKVITNEHEFSVTEEFADFELKNKTIEFSVSRIFKEINWYKLYETSDRFYFSLRTYTGLVVPVLLLLAMLTSYYFKRNIDIFLFIIKVLLLADFIFLII